MRAFMMVCVAAIVFAVLGLYLVGLGWQQTADQAFSSSTSVRLSHEVQLKSIKEQSDVPSMGGM